MTRLHAPSSDRSSSRASHLSIEAAFNPLVESCGTARHRDSTDDRVQQLHPWKPRQRLWCADRESRCGGERNQEVDIGFRDRPVVGPDRRPGDVTTPREESRGHRNGMSSHRYVTTTVRGDNNRAATLVPATRYTIVTTVHISAPAAC